MTLTLRFAAKSDRGLIREGNEDSVFAGPRLLAVADGMGGMAAGEVASNIVVGALAPLDEDAPGADLVQELKDAVDDANEQLRAAVEENPALEGMGTTLTAILFSGNRLALVNVGDSRTYLLRDKEIKQITRDDTYVQMLVDEGRITADEATSHPQRSILTRALDGREVDPDFSVREAVPGDRYLLCSDGLSSVVSEETIAEALGTGPPPEACDRLVALALRGGGPDNITVIVADILDEQAGDDHPVVGGAASRDRGRTSTVSPDSAAGRAALARPRSEPEPEPEDEEDPDPHRKRRRIRTALLLALALVVVVAGGIAGWTYIQAQFYVGAKDGQVMIFRGVRGSVGGAGLSTVAAAGGIKLDDLQPVAQQQVKEGITATSESDARAIVNRLKQNNLKPVCEPVGTAPAVPSRKPGPTPAPTPTPAAAQTPTPAPDNVVDPNCRKP